MQTYFIVLTALMALVIYFDLTRYLIPNWLVGLVVAFYVPMVFMSHGSVPWLYAIGVMLGVFALGYIAYIMRWMGGGDIKLMAACALWASHLRVLDFLIITALMGGVLALALLVVRRLLPALPARLALRAAKIRLFRNGEPVPYGLAIAGAFLLLLWQQQLPGLSLH